MSKVVNITEKVYHWSCADCIAEDVNYDLRTATTSARQHADEEQHETIVLLLIRRIEP